jgi:hypothetical protein
MSNEYVINVSRDKAGNQVAFSTYEETANKKDVIALYTQALALMETLTKEAVQSGEFRRQIPSMHFEDSMFEPFSIPFKIISDNSTGASFEVAFTDKNYTALNTAFGQIILKEKRKQVRRPDKKS